jgi:hypothetical protein
VRNELVFFTLLIGTGAGVVLAADSEPPSQQSRITDLINQLGSKNYRERDAATKELDAIGAPAMEALRNAAKNPDMEIADRAAALVIKIEQRAENARLIAPTYVELTLKDSPVEYAVAELSRKSGYTIVIVGDKSKLARRKVTLETGKVPFWKALEMLCEKAELDESDLAPALPTSTAVPTTTQRTPIQKVAPPVPVKPIEVQPAPQKAPQGFSVDQPIADEAPKKEPVPAQPAVAPPAVPAIPLNPPFPAPAQPRQGGAVRVISAGQIGAGAAIALVDGKPNTSPAHVEGAVRIRAFDSADVRAKFAPVPAGEIGVFLEVRAEPKIQVMQVLGVKVDKAIDNNDQRLKQSMVASDANQPVNGAQPPLPVPGQRIVGRPANIGSIDRQTVVARLKQGEKPAKSIAELRGVVSLKVRTAAEELAAVENILKAKGQSTKGKFDATLKIVDVKTAANGDIEIEVELQHSQEILPVRDANFGLQFNGGLQINGNIQIQIAPALPNGGPAPPPVPLVVQGGVISGAYNGLGLELIDAKGTPIKLVQMRQTRVQVQANERTSVATMMFHPEKDQEAAKLAFKGTWLAVVDVPFVLKDVPVK